MIILLVRLAQEVPLIVSKFNDTYNFAVGSSSVYTTVTLTIEAAELPYAFPVLVVCRTSPCLSGQSDEEAYSLALPKQFVITPTSVFSSQGFFTVLSNSSAVNLVLKVDIGQSNAKLCSPNC
jgi:hypothetical protein